MANEKTPFPDTTFKGHEFARSDMTGASFNGVDLSEASVWAVMKNARFHDCNLASCEFDDVNLSGSTYDNINLSNASFQNINMSGVSLSSLNLSGAEINDANLDGMKINGVLVTDLFSAYQASR